VSAVKGLGVSVRGMYGLLDRRYESVSSNLG
jgi:hypothetical protein